MRRSLLILLLALAATLRAAAYDFEHEGIYYEITGDNEVTVTTSGDPNDYADEVQIPEFVEHDGKEYMVTAIAPGTFVGCVYLLYVECPPSIHGDLCENFNECPNLEKVILRGTFNTIERVFWGCPRLDGVYLEGVSCRIREAFIGCLELRGVCLEGDIEIEGLLFADCPHLDSVHFGRGVRGALPILFSNCPNLTWIDVAFDNPYYDSRNDCNAIIETATNTLIKGCRSTIIPESVTAIGYRAFDGCSGLESIDIPEGVTAIGDYAFAACLSLTSINLPESLTTIGELAFGDCSSLTSINLPESLTTIGERAFYACPCITEFQVADGNPVYAAVDGVMFNKEKTAILHYPAGRKDETYTIPEGVTAIGNNAFSDCNSLTSLVIPEGVTAIGDWAFAHCNSLTSISFPESLTAIDGWAFYACSSLMSIKVPESLTTISESAFRGCPCITEFQVADGNPVYAAVDGVMFNKEKTAILHYPAGRKDETCTIPEGVTSIGNYAFSDCNSLTSLVIPTAVTSIGNYAFLSCSSLATITLHSLPTSVGRDAIPTTTSILVPRALYDAAVAMFPRNKVITETPIDAYDHILYTSGAELRVGDYGTVDFALKNANPVTGFQFDLTLPEGITFATDEYGDPMIEIVEGRTNAKRHAVTWQEQPSGAMRILCTSMSNATFTANDGAVLRLTLRADNTVKLGTYDLAINKMIISQPDNSRHHIDYAQFPIDIVNYTFGDLDGDDDFTVSDVTATVNFILNTNTEGLDRRAADLNRDGEVTITDAVAVINLVLGSTVGSSHRAPAAFSPYATLSIADFSIAAGQSIVLPVRLAGCTDAFSAMQFDLMLPEGLSLVDVSADRRHQAIFAPQANGAQRIVALSTANASYTADADVLFLTLVADDAFTGGTVTLDAIELASPALATFRPEAASALAIGTAPTALEDLQTSKPENLIYDLQGRRTSSTTTGVIVKHGQKIMK